MTENALTAKQVLFIEHYLACFNATEAARRAGYSEKTAYAIGAENLRKPQIADAIKSRMKEIMPAVEVVSRLADHARGSMADFLVIAEEQVVIERRTSIKNETLTEETEYATRPIARLDLEAAAKAGRLPLVKKYTLTDKGVSIELYDAQAALEKLGKMHGLFIDKQEVSGPNGKELIIRYEDASNND